MAKSPRRSANSSKPQRRSAGHAGRRISMMISSGASAVVSAPERNPRPDYARTGLARHRDLRVARDRDAGHLGRRIGMRDAAADGAAVADLIMRHVRRPRRTSSGCARAAARRPGYRASAPWRRAATPALLILISSSPAACAGRPAARARASRNASIGTRLCPPASSLGVAVTRRQQRDRLGERRRARIFERRAASWDLADGLSSCDTHRRQLMGFARRSTQPRSEPQRSYIGRAQPVNVAARRRGPTVCGMTAERGSMALQLSLSVCDYDRTRAIFDGRAPIEGCDVTAVAAGARGVVSPRLQVQRVRRQRNLACAATR